MFLIDLMSDNESASEFIFFILTELGFSVS